MTVTDELAGQAMWLRTDTLRVDHSYQRPESIHREEFDHDLAGSLLVGARSNGRLYVCDGQRRRATALRDGVEEVLCWVVPSTGPRFEADLYTRANKVKPQSPMDRYRAELKAGHTLAKQMKAITEKHGYQLDSAMGRTHVRSIGTVKRMVHLSPERYDKILGIIKKLEKHNDLQHLLSSKFLYGMFNFLDRYEDHEHYSEATLVRRLNNISVYKTILMSSLAGGVGVQKQTGAAIRDAYNFKTQTKRLPY